jgi:TorA maturation chaperone TorD/formate hydrogenlyase subunit 6/NADH:ubiquinone oxidoreductase subunit I
MNHVVISNQYSVFSGLDSGRYMNQPALRAQLYQALAEVLTEPPDWLALAGRHWPLLDCALQLALYSEAARTAVAGLAEIRAEPMRTRRARYQALFAGSGRPRCWLYESAYDEGGLFGESCLELGRLYQAAGLEVTGSELPDHAAVELAFLAYLARRAAEEPEQSAAWSQLERRFIKKHAGRWLPGVGREMAGSADTVYAPIGRLLAEWLAEAVRPVAKPAQVRRPRWPQVSRRQDCTLCGFCIQVCPTRALKIHESGRETSLLLFDAHCVSCAKCERVCPTGTLQMTASKGVLKGETAVDSLAAKSWRCLRRSPRAICPACGAATISCAELEFVASQIGQPDWLAYCLTCRAQLA